MNHGERLRASRREMLADIDVALMRIPMLSEHRELVRQVVLAAFEAGYEAAEPKLCARCGAEVESGKDGVE